MWCILVRCIDRLDIWFKHQKIYENLLKLKEEKTDVKVIAELDTYRLVVADLELGMLLMERNKWYNKIVYKNLIIKIHHNIKIFEERVVDKMEQLTDISNPSRICNEIRNNNNNNNKHCWENMWKEYNQQKVEKDRVVDWPSEVVHKTKQLPRRMPKERKIEIIT